MSVEVVINRNIVAGGKSINSRLSLSGGALYELDETIPSGEQTDLAVALVIDVSQMVAIYLHSDKAVTLEFNSSSSPSKTITLVANQAFSWDNLSGHTNPFGSTDVTGVFVTKAGTPAARLRGYVLTDPTV